MKCVQLLKDLPPPKSTRICFSSPLLLVSLVVELEGFLLPGGII